MAVTASQVKELRETTGVGMMDCKKALSETDGNMEAAVDWLRSKGLAKAAKKADRVAAEGLVGVFAEGNKAAVIELNSETDFVARNEAFQGMVAAIAKVAVGTDGDVESVGKAAFPGSSHSVVDEVTEAVATIGENMNLRRSAVLSVTDGVVGSYVHAAVVPGMGKIGVLVALQSTGDKAALEGLGRQLAMHVAAASPSPLALAPADLDQDIVAREREVFKQQAIESGKPAEIAEKMVDGRMRKYYEEVCLLSQTYVIDGETKISDVVKNAEAAAGAPVELTGFVRFALGEGVEKEESDFAAEVAATAGAK